MTVLDTALPMYIVNVLIVVSLPSHLAWSASSSSSPYVTDCAGIRSRCRAVGCPASAEFGLFPVLSGQRRRANWSRGARVAGNDYRSGWNRDGCPQRRRAVPSAANTAAFVESAARRVVRAPHRQQDERWGASAGTAYGPIGRYTSPSWLDVIVCLQGSLS